MFKTVREYAHGHGHSHRPPAVTCEENAAERKTRATRKATDEGRVDYENLSTDRTKASI